MRALKVTANQSVAGTAVHIVHSMHSVAGRLTDKAAHGDLARQKVRGAGVEAQQVWGTHAQTALQMGGWRLAGFLPTTSLGS